MQFQNFVFTRL